MVTTQIYTLVNSVNQQAFGSGALTATDPAGLISIGNQVLSSSTNTEAFLNTLLQRVGRTVIRYRMYNNKLRNLVVDDMQWGAILQKIHPLMPDAVADDMYTLTDGQSIDHYEVKKPQATQKLFVTRAPYMFFITIQRETLREAFLSESAMAAFISAIFGQVQNKIETTLENLGRLTIAAGIAEANAREYALVTAYNSLTGPGAPLTAATAMFSSDFLRFALKTMKRVMDGMTDMSELYNDGTVPSFTPYEDQRIIVLSEFEYALETVVEWAAFNEQYVKLENFTKLNFWQEANAPGSILTTTLSTSAQVGIDNVIACVHDRDALGVYQEFNETLTTPVNARGAYYNTFFHRRDGRFVDTSENLVFFTLN